MTIKYILSFPTSLIYHVFAQIDFKKEWGPASLFCLPYIELIKKYNKNLLIAEKNKNDLKNILKNYFVAITFMCLRPEYKDYDTMIKDLSDNKLLKEQIEHYCLLNLPYKDTKNAFEYLVNLLENLKEKYCIYWSENKNSFNKKKESLRNVHSNIFSNYCQYLHNKINPAIHIKNEYLVFTVPSLFTYGRGIKNGCAIGIPYHKNQLKEIIPISMHEVTHSFTNPLLVHKTGINPMNNPTNESHQIKEQLAEYVTQEYLKRHCPELARKMTISYPLLTDKIKNDLGI